MTTKAVDPGQILAQMDKDATQLEKMRATLRGKKSEYNIRLTESELKGGRPDRNLALLKSEIEDLKGRVEEKEERQEARQAARPELIRRAREKDFHDALPEAAPAIQEYQAATAEVLATGEAHGQAVERWMMALTKMENVLGRLHASRVAAGISDPMPTFPGGGLHNVVFRGGVTLMDLWHSLTGNDRAKPLRNLPALMRQIRATQAKGE